MVNDPPGAGAGAGSGVGVGIGVGAGAGAGIGVGADDMQLNIPFIAINEHPLEHTKC